MRPFWLRLPSAAPLRKGPISFVSATRSLLANPFGADLGRLRTGPMPIGVETTALPRPYAKKSGRLLEYRNQFAGLGVLFRSFPKHVRAWVKLLEIL